LPDGDRACLNIAPCSDAIRDRRPAEAHAAMTRIVDGVMVLIARAEESG
jgi:hypothetical protein